MYRLVAINAVALLLSGCENSSVDQNNELHPAKLCEVAIPAGLSGAQIYNLASRFDAYACDIGQAETLILEASGSCDDPRLGRLRGGEEVTRSEAEARFQRCNLAAAPHRREGRFSTKITLVGDGLSDEEMFRFQDLISTFALRVPLHGLFMDQTSRSFCFQYNDKDVFRGRISSLEQHMPPNVRVDHHDDKMCSALIDDAGGSS